MKKYLAILFLIAFTVPSVALASWWNPFSWFNNWSFNKKEAIPQVQVEVEKTTPSADNSAIVIKTEQDIAKQETKEQVRNNTVSVSPDVLICNGKEWSKCPAGHNFYCPAQGDAQCVPQLSVLTNNQVNTSVKQDPPPSLAPQQTSQETQKTSPSNTILCNGKYWTPCSSGRELICPANGDAYCKVQLTQVQLQRATNNKNNFIQRFDILLKDYRDFRDIQSKEIDAMNQMLVELGKYTGAITELKVTLTKQRRERLIKSLSSFNQLITARERMKSDYQNLDVEMYLENNFEDALQDGSSFLNKTKTQFEQDKAVYYDYISKQI